MAMTETPTRPFPKIDLPCAGGDAPEALASREHTGWTLAGPGTPDLLRIPPQGTVHLHPVSGLHGALGVHPATKHPEIEVLVRQFGDVGMQTRFLDHLTQGSPGHHPNPSYNLPFSLGIGDLHFNRPGGLRLARAPAGGFSTHRSCPRPYRCRARLQKASTSESAISLKSGLSNFCMIRLEKAKSSSSSIRQARSVHGVNCQHPSSRWKGPSTSEISMRRRGRSVLRVRND